jgi:hypothetical protein
VSVEGDPRPAFALGANLGKADARWLMLLPLAVGVIFGLLLLPWSSVPEGVPLPVCDRAELGRVAAADRAEAERARAHPLPGPVRALGSALRTFHALEAHPPEGDERDRELGMAREAVDKELGNAMREGEPELLALRAVQLDGFLAEVAGFEETGQVSPELEAVAGTFVQSMTGQGWCTGHHLAAGPDVLRVMFKEMWNGFVGLGGQAAFQPTLDEVRALYAFYLGHPHAPTSVRDRAIAMRSGARDARDCAAADALERRATEKWRLERIARIAAMDPAYPAAFARGVSSFGTGSYEASADAFRSWLQDHPDGPYTLRAQAFLRAAVAAARID